jgi:hypothetical protein
MIAIVRCEPLLELRGVDGWHWVRWANGKRQPMAWDTQWGLAPPRWNWLGGSRTPEEAADAGWEYIEPVLTIVEVEALRAERDALLAEKTAYESPAWEANESLNAAADMLRDRVAKLEDALNDAAQWHEAQAKALSKQPPGGDRDWRRLEHSEQEGNARVALAKSLTTSV